MSVSVPPSSASPPISTSSSGPPPVPAPAQSPGADFPTAIPRATTSPKKGSGGSGNNTRPSGRVRARRNWGYVAAGVGLMALTALTFAVIWATGRTTTSVLALASTVHRGQAITADDLTVAHAFADPALTLVPSAQVAEVIGQRAALDLPAGTLLTPVALTGAQIPAVGRSLVGLHLSPAQLPLTPLHPGDSVSVVNAGREGDTGSAAAEVVAAIVVASGISEDGAHIVDVTVPSQSAPRVASWVATGRAAVYLEASSAQGPAGADSGMSQQ